MADSTKHFLNRREFITKSVIGVAGLSVSSSLVAAVGATLSSCAQLDRKIMEDGPDDSGRVIIIGAGLSGLVAARELKLAGIPFRVYEGSGRVGGRTLTLGDFNEASQSAEMGAEWVSETDEFVLNLCKELRMQTLMVPTSQRTPNLYNENKWILKNLLEKEIRKLDKILIDKKEKIAEPDLDRMSVEVFLQDHFKNFSHSQLLWMKRLVELEFGASPTELSMLAYYEHFNSDLSGWSNCIQKRIRIFGGSQNISKVLFDKISGIIPNRLILFHHKLQAIRPNGDKIQLEFQTNDGIKEIETKILINTLPFSVLRDLRGVEDMEFSDKKIKAIQELGYGTQSKQAASFKEKFWQNDNCVWTGNLESDWIWDSSQSIVSSKLITRGILSSQISGENGRLGGLHTIQSLKSDLKKIKSYSDQEIDNYQIMNWNMNTWSKGSASYFKPGQIHEFSNDISTSERAGQCIFAGDHTSNSSMASMNGAIESGLRAAQEAIAKFKS